MMRLPCLWFRMPVPYLILGILGMGNLPFTAIELLRRPPATLSLSGWELTATSREEIL